MEHSCIVFRHGGYSGYRNASLSCDASFLYLPIRHPLWPARDGFVNISCRFDKMTEYMRPEVEMLRTERRGVC